MPEQHPQGGTWRERHDEARQRQIQAKGAMREATRDRARALLEGIAEHGGPPPAHYGGLGAVARVLGTTPQAISKAIKSYKDADRPR